MQQSHTILVVDDQPGVRRLIQEVLQEVGYRVLTAANGLEALSVARSESPALVLLDMKMPVMDGLEALRVLKDEFPTLRVLLMTAVGDGDHVSEAIALGAQTCISKPFDVFALRALVQHMLEEGESA